MSFKKFTRHHGRSGRIKKYRWSNPDHRWSDSTSQRSCGRPGLRGYINVPESKMCYGCYGGKNGKGMKSGMAKKDRRKLRRCLDIKIRIWYH